MNGRILLIYRQIEYHLHVPIDEKSDGSHNISIDLVQNLIFSLLSLPPENQTFISLTDFCIFGSFHANVNHFAAENGVSVNAPSLSFKNNEIRLLLLNDNASSDPFPSDWDAICTRCVLGTVPILQPIYRSMEIASETSNVMCRSCAESCTTGIPMDPLEWVQRVDSHPSFISSIVIVSGDFDVTAPESFVKLPWDINVMGSGPSVFLCIQRDNRRALTSIEFVEFSRSQIHLESEVALLSIKSTDAFGITDLRVIYGKDTEIPQGYIRSSARSDDMDVYLCYSLVPLFAFTCSEKHCDIGDCLFASRFSISRHLLEFTVLQWMSFMVLRANRLESNRKLMQMRYKEKELEMQRRLLDGLHRVSKYEDPIMQQAARMHIPIERLKREASSCMEDALLLELLHWFKREFFTWTNQPKCASCRNEKTRYRRTEHPQSDEEIQGDASRVEIYECDSCHNLTRFPRYNNPVKLLSTRTGRCGEWANCFTLCCRAMGFDARYVLDVTDHVWTEVFLAREHRWVHCDACEDQMDAPLTYEVGWGKKLSYIFAFSKDEVVDVARRYTKDWEVMLSRRVDADEEWLKDAIDKLNDQKMRGLPDVRVVELKERRASEQREMYDAKKKVSGDVGGRVSGSAEWKRAREEDGAKSTSVDRGHVKLISKLDSGKPIVENVAKELCRMMTIGCDNVACVNPHCFRKRKSDGLNATDTLVQALQTISFMSDRLSAAGMASMLCEKKPAIRSVILQYSPRLYLPMQDEPSTSKCMLIDISGNGNHVENVDCCLMEKPFRLYDFEGSDCQLENNRSVGILPGEKLEFTLDNAGIELSQSIGVSFLLRFEEIAPEDVKTSSVFTISLQEKKKAVVLVEFVVVISSERKLSLDVSVNSERYRADGVVSFHEPIAIGLSVSKDGLSVFQNGKMVADLTAFPPLTSEISLTLCGSGKRTINLLSHFTVFTSPTFREQLASLTEELYRRFIPWKSLQSISNGTLIIKSCRDKVASVQSNCRVARVRLWGVTFLDGLQFVYERIQDETVKDSTPIFGTLWGNSIASEHKESPAVELTLFPFEFITEMSGGKGAWIDSLSVQTNFKRTITCGGSGGDSFKINGPNSMQEIRSIELAVGDHLNDPIAFFGSVQAPEHPLAKELDDICSFLTDAPKRLLTLTAMQRYLENLCESPTEPKYQRIRVGNPYFVKCFGHLSALQQDSILNWCGFFAEKSDGQVYYCWKETDDEVKVNTCVGCRGESLYSGEGGNKRLSWQLTGCDMKRAFVSAGSNAISNAFVCNDVIRLGFESDEIRKESITYWGAYGTSHSVALLTRNAMVPSLLQIGPILHPSNRASSTENTRITSVYLHELNGVTNVLAGDSKGSVYLWNQNQTSHSEWNQIQLRDGTAGISAVCAGNTGKYWFFLAAVSDGTIRAWKCDINADESIMNLAIPSDESRIINVISTSPINSHKVLVALGGLDHKIFLYELTNTGSWTQKSILEGHCGWIRDIKLFPMCQTKKESDTYELLLASASQDHKIRVWKVTPKGREATCHANLETILTAHEDWVTSLQWILLPFNDHQSSLTLLSSSMDNSLILWDAGTIGKVDGHYVSKGSWKPVHRLGELGGNGLLSAHAISRANDEHTNSLQITALTFSGQLERWHANIEECVSGMRFAPSIGLTGHTAAVTDLLWSPQSGYLLTVSSDQTARIWAPSVLTKMWHEISRAQVHGYDINCACFIKKSPTRYVCGADEKVLRIFIAPDEIGKRVDQLSQMEHKVEAERDAIPHAYLPELSLTNKRSMTEHNSQVSEDDGYVILDYNDLDGSVQLPVGSVLGRQTLWPEIRKLYGHANEILSVASNHDGRILASSCKSREERFAGVWLWDTDTWEPLSVSPLNGHTCSVVQLEFSPNDSYLVSVSRDRHFCVYKRQLNSTESGIVSPYQLLCRQKAHKRIIWTCSWSPDSLYLATGSRDQTIGLWKIEDSGANWCSATECLCFNDSVTAVAFAPVLVHASGDPQYLLAAGLENGEIHFVRIGLCDGKLIMRCTDTAPSSTTCTETILLSTKSVGTPSSTITRLAWRPSSDSELTLAASSRDGSVHIYEMNRSIFEKN
uniref:Elongator complex protein 2 n=1 Tax=Albugo laibachii Nc14 TaxID=890382 RepID=F0WL18_9STRA|nr:peptideN(4)(Nacetylbetaglucosaminyl)asparagine amidase putative [Albugo laibachii Nc14]|eukprot:CCA21977.1 peptideN(4)(Nacetylbetaglucosaminyl)asparagine amidase putative [Albugo laibachii Nc14]